MPRLFVNSMSNFMIQGGIVSFTLQDQAMKTQKGQPHQSEPEDIANVVMREQDFAMMLQFFNQHHAAYQQQAGRPVGGGQAGAKPGAQQSGLHANPAGAKPAATGSGFKIRPKDS